MLPLGWGEMTVLPVVTDNQYQRTRWIELSCLYLNVISVADGYHRHHHQHHHHQSATREAVTIGTHEGIYTNRITAIIITATRAATVTAIKFFTIFLMMPTIRIFKVIFKRSKILHVILIKCLNN